MFKRFVKEHSGNSKVPAATYHIAVEENRRGNNEESLNSFILIYSAYPNSEFVGEAYLWSGNLLAAKGELVQAEKNLRKALTYTLTTDSTQKCKFMLANVLQKLKKEDESISIMKDLLDNNISNTFSPQNLAWLSNNLIDRKYWSDAEKAAVKLASDIEASDAWKQMGWALAARADVYKRQTLGNALNCLAAREGESEGVTDIVTGLRDAIIEGYTFSDALEKYPKVFSNIYTNMIRAGEASGAMTDVLHRLSLIHI